MKTYPLLEKAPCHVDILGTGGIGLPILNLGTRWKWVVSYTLRSH